MNRTIGIADAFLTVDAMQVPNKENWWDYVCTNGNQSTEEVDDFVAWLMKQSQHFEATGTGVRWESTEITVGDWVVIGMDGRVYAFDDRHYQMLYGDSDD